MSRFKYDQRSPLQRAKDALSKVKEPESYADIVQLSAVDVFKLNTLNSPFVSQGDGLTISPKAQAFLRKHGVLG